VRVLIEWKGWEFLRLRIVSLSRRSGNRWWSKALPDRTGVFKNLPDYRRVEVHQISD